MRNKFLTTFHVCAVTFKHYINPVQTIVQDTVMWRSVDWNLDSEWDWTKFWRHGYTAELLSLSLSLFRLLTCKIDSLSTENPSRNRCTNHRYSLGRCFPVVTTPPIAMSRSCYHRNDGRKLAISLTVYEFPWNVYKTPWAISYLFYSLKLPDNIQGFFQH